MKRRSFLSSITLLFFIVATFIPALNEKAYALGSTYYVDSVAGSDTNDGLSSSQPWQSLAKVNATTFSPGDRILMKSGSTWSGQLAPKGSGTSGNPIVIDIYGGATKPIINGNVTGDANGLFAGTVYLFNQEYWEINNLEITNNSTTAGNRLGVQVVAQDYGTANHVYLKNLYIHHVKGDNGNKITGGIAIQVLGGTVQTKWNDVLIDGNTIASVDRSGIVTNSSWCNRHNITTCLGDWYASTNIVIQNNNVSDLGGDGIVPRVTDGALVQYNVVHDASVRSGVANVAIWAFDADNTIFQFNEAYLTRTTKDGQGYDIDWAQDGTIFQYNYSHDNEGGFITFATDGSKGPTTTNGVVRYNISQNDKTRLIQIAGPSTNMNIYNNTFYLPPGSTTSPIVAQAWNGGNPVSSYFYNNIFYLLGSGAWTGLHLFTTLEFDYNTFYGVHASGEPSDAHKLTTDPLLVNAGSGGTGRLTVDGYKLRTGSPALGSGVLMANNGGLDYWGNSVSNTANPNRGAYNGAGIVVNSTTLTPAADAFIYDGSSVTNYGSASYLLVKDDAAGYKRRSYLKFNLSGISTVSSAKLRLYGNNTTDANTVYVKTYGTTTNSWTETGINWNNAPAITTSYLSSIPINSTPAYYEFDVTSFVQAQLANGTVSLVVLCNVLDGKYIQFNSKEATVNRPQLVIQ